MANRAKELGQQVITPEVVEQATRTILQAPFNRGAQVEETAAEQTRRLERPLEGITMHWTAEAKERVRKIPVASVRRTIARRVEEYARQLGRETVDLEAYEAGRRTGDLE